MKWCWVFLKITHMFRICIIFLLSSGNLLPPPTFSCFPSPAEGHGQLLWNIGELRIPGRFLQIVSRSQLGLKTTLKQHRGITLSWKLSYWHSLLAHPLEGQPWKGLKRCCEFLSVNTGSLNLGQATSVSSRPWLFLWGLVTNPEELLRPSLISWYFGQIWKGWDASRGMLKAKGACNSPTLTH